MSGIDFHQRKNDRNNHLVELCATPKTIDEIIETDNTRFKGFIPSYKVGYWRDVADNLVKAGKLKFDGVTNTYIKI